MGCYVYRHAKFRNSLKRYSTFILISYGNPHLPDRFSIANTLYLVALLCRTKHTHAGPGCSARNCTEPPDHGANFQVMLDQTVFWDTSVLACRMARICSAASRDVFASAPKLLQYVCFGNSRFTKFYCPLNESTCA